LVSMARTLRVRDFLASVSRADGLLPTEGGRKLNDAQTNPTL
jgi:hypothetical protein